MSNYESDLVVWTERQADLLRRMGAGERVNDQIDWENIAEEIDSLGRSQRRELRSRVRTILLHLIKLQLSPAADPQRSWRQTIMRERTEIKALIRDSPSLVRLVPSVINDELPDARELAAGDLGVHGEPPQMDPSVLTYSEEQVLGPWLPK